MKRLIGSALIHAFVLDKHGTTAFTDLDGGFAVSLKCANHD